MWSLPWRPPRSPFRALTGARLHGMPTLADRGEVPLAAQDRFDGAVFPDRKDDDRHPVLPSKRERRRIHDLQVSIQRLLMIEAFVALRRRIPFGISSIDAIDIGRLEDRIASHLGGAQDCRGV